MEPTYNASAILDAKAYIEAYDTEMRETGTVYKRTRDIVETMPPELRRLALQQEEAETAPSSVATNATPVELDEVEREVQRKLHCTTLDEYFTIPGAEKDICIATRCEVVLAWNESSVAANITGWEDSRAVYNSKVNAEGRRVGGRPPAVRRTQLATIPFRVPLVGVGQGFEDALMWCCARYVRSQAHVRHGIDKRLASHVAALLRDSSWHITGGELLDGDYSYQVKPRRVHVFNFAFTETE